MNESQFCDMLGSHPSAQALLLEPTFPLHLHLHPPLTPNTRVLCVTDSHQCLGFCLISGLVATVKVLMGCAAATGAAATGAVATQNHVVASIKTHNSVTTTHPTHPHQLETTQS